MIGRAKVVVLNQGVEKPSDVDGIVYIPYPDGNWQLELGQEMGAAGLDVDLNRLD
jgi:predicted nucleotide-binding protein